MNNALSTRPLSHRLARGLASACVVAALAAASICTAHAQSTTGAVAGKAPAGDRVTVHNENTSVRRTVTVDANGRYAASDLPPGTYSVTLAGDGQAIARHIHVPVLVGSSSEVDFTCKQIRCDRVANTR